MTLDDFTAITAQRIPTPAEFVAFVESQGWRINLSGDGERAGLRVPNRQDPLANALADVLKREPYRTNVLAEVRQRAEYDPPNESRPDTVVTDPNPPAPRPTAGPTVCPTCDADIYPAATRADIAQLCDRAPCHYLTPELWRGHHGRS